MDKFLYCIKQYLLINYSMTEYEIQIALNNSAINQLLEDDAEMVMCDSIDEWAEQIYKECKSLNKKS